MNRIKYSRELFLSKEIEHKIQPIHYQHLPESWASFQNIEALHYMIDLKVD